MDSGRLDEDCHARFLKINAAYVIEESNNNPQDVNSTMNSSAVSGVLLVTPNAIMFDPNVSDALVIQHGAIKYGAIIPMENILSAAIYSEIVPRAVRKTSRVESIPFSSLVAHHAALLEQKKEDKPTQSNSMASQPPGSGDVLEENESPEELMEDGNEEEEEITAAITTPAATVDLPPASAPAPSLSPRPTRRVSARSGTLSSGEGFFSHPDGTALSRWCHFFSRAYRFDLWFI